MDDPIVTNLAMMLRRMVWLVEKDPGESSLKILAGNAKQLLQAYGLEGLPTRDEP